MGSYAGFARSRSGAGLSARDYRVTGNAVIAPQALPTASAAQPPDAPHRERGAAARCSPSRRNAPLTRQQYLPEVRR